MTSKYRNKLLKQERGPWHNIKWSREANTLVEGRELKHFLLKNAIINSIVNHNTSPFLNLDLKEKCLKDI